MRAKGLSGPSGTSTLVAIPTRTHMALVDLVREGMIKHVISQNCDGLHRRSGIHPSTLSELHGNSNIERCRACQKEYLRDYRVRTAEHVHEHSTGRQCEACGGDLEDTIVNFGENLPEHTLVVATGVGAFCLHVFSFSICRCRQSAVRR